MSGKRKRGASPARKRRRRSELLANLEQINLNTAGIDIGATEHWVAVPEDRNPQPVQRFEAFTTDLYALADFLEACGHADG